MGAKLRTALTGTQVSVEHLLTTETVITYESQCSTHQMSTSTLAAPQQGYHGAVCPFMAQTSCILRVLPNSMRVYMPVCKWAQMGASNTGTRAVSACAGHCYHSSQPSLQQLATAFTTTSSLSRACWKCIKTQTTRHRICLPPTQLQPSMQRGIGKRPPVTWRKLGQSIDKIFCIRCSALSKWTNDSQHRPNGGCYTHTLVVQKSGFLQTS